jgi:hypothetical protein
MVLISHRHNHDLNQKIQNVCYKDPEFLLMTYIKKSGITNLEPNIIVQSF